MCEKKCHRMFVAVAVIVIAGLSAGTVRFDERSVIIDDSRSLIFSGAIHFARVMPADWEPVLIQAKEMGLNTIQTYVMWNFHEHERGKMVWSDRRNATRFVELAGRHGLDVVVRIGPYVCGEYQFGGLPVWLRTLDNIQCFRCSDPVWKREMARFTNTVVNLLRPQLKSRGGPIVMLQIENEYNGPDLNYLKWAVEMARNTTQEVPWILCHDHKKCAAVNTAPNGSHVDNALCTINGFWMDERSTDYSQPSPAWLTDLHRQNPGQPWIWTEDQGWFDQWQVAKRVRDLADQSYGIARFFAWGGSWHNFYMLTGGNNYGRQSGGSVITAYAPDTAIDSFLLRHEPAFSHFGTLFRTLANYSNDLLSHPIAKPRSLIPPSVNATTYLQLQPCTDTDPAHMGLLDGSQQWQLGVNGSLRNIGTNLCVDAVSAEYDTVTLHKCPRSGSDPRFKWSYVSSTQQLKSAVVEPCKAKKAKAKMCHRCLDMIGQTAGVDSWDCKPANDPHLANQQWLLYNPKSGPEGLKGSSSGLCLTAVVTSTGGAEVHEYGSVAFLSNYDETQTFQVTYRGMQYYLPNHTVCIIDTKTASVVWNSSAVWGRLPHRTELQQVPEGTTSAAWSAFFESPGFGAETQTADVPLEMLALTNDNTDYIWYSVTVETAETKSANPVVHAAGSNGAITYIYVNGVPQRADTEWQTQNSTVKLDILACAMGISNGDVGPHSTKGLNLPVAVNGATISNTGQYKWTHSWVLQGERDQIFTTTGAAKVVWKQVTSEDEANATAVWFRGSFDMPKIDHQATQTSYALDLSTMNKGVAYVNGFNLGRYWLTPGKCTGACAPPVKSGHCYMHWKGCDKPTQTLYHVPTELLKPTANLVVLFEETSHSVQQRSLSGVRLRALHDHPA